MASRPMNFAGDRTSAFHVGQKFGPNLNEDLIFEATAVTYNPFTDRTTVDCRPMALHDDARLRFIGSADDDDDEGDADGQ